MKSGLAFLLFILIHATLRDGVYLNMNFEKEASDKYSLALAIVSRV